MLKYAIKRTILAIPVIISMTIIVFLILHLSPGEPIDLIVGPNITPEVYESIRHKYGLDQPLIVQYFKFLGNLLRGDFGKSILQQRPVSEIIKQRLPITIRLGVTGFILSVVIAIPLGILAAVNRNTPIDYTCMTGAMLGMSLPTFWFGLLLLYFFAYKIRIFPVSGYGTWRHLVLPAFALGLTDAAITARMMRSSMLEVLKQDYIRTARSKGLAEKIVVYQHALKNAMIPIVTLLGMRLGWILGGSVVLETIFSIPGLGRLMIDSILSRDYPVVQGSMIVLTSAIILGNIFADILYAVIDPRIKFD